jgi:hypothetical protein
MHARHSSLPSPCAPTGSAWSLPFPNLGSSSAKSSSTVASSMVGGTFHSPPSAILRIVERSVLPERVSGIVWADDSLQHREADWDLTLQLVGNSDDGAFGDVVICGPFVTPACKGGLARKPVGAGPEGGPPELEGRRPCRVDRAEALAGSYEAWVNLLRAGCRSPAESARGSMAREPAGAL